MVRPLPDPVIFHERHVVEPRSPGIKRTPISIETVGLEWRGVCSGQSANLRESDHITRRCQKDHAEIHPDQRGLSAGGSDQVPTGPFQKQLMPNQSSIMPEPIFAVCARPLSVILG